MNCCEAPSAIDGFCGVMLMLTNVGGVMVREAVPEMLPEVALMVAEPAETLVVRPMVAAALLMVATVPSEELQ